MLITCMINVLIKLAAAIHTAPDPLWSTRRSSRCSPALGTTGSLPTTPHLGVTVALLVMIYRRWLGTVLLAAAIVVEAARMAAHVHHGQDIFAGMLIAVVAVGIASAAWRWLDPGCRSG